MSVWSIKRCELIKDRGQLKYCQLYLKYSLSNKNNIENQKLFNIATDIIIKRIIDYFNDTESIIYYREKNSTKNSVKLFIICAEGKECCGLINALLEADANII